MRFRILLVLSLLLTPLSLVAYPSAGLSGNLDRNHVLRGQTLEFDITVKLDTPFKGKLALYLHTSEGLQLKATTITPPLFNCTPTSDYFKTCAGSDFPIGSINVHQTILVDNNATHEIQTFSAELGGDFLSGTPLLVGLISIDTPRPHIEATEDKLTVVKGIADDLTFTLGLTNMGDADGTANISIGFSTPTICTVTPASVTIAKETSTLITFRIGPNDSVPGKLTGEDHRQAAARCGPGDPGSADHVR